MGGKVSRFIRNYDAERRALKVLSKQSEHPAGAPSFTADQQRLREVAKDPVLEAAINKRDARLLENLTKVKVVSSIPLTPPIPPSDRPLPQRRYYIPFGELGVSEIPTEKIPQGRLSLQQFQELLNTREPVGGLTSAAAEELLEFYAPLMQRTESELKQLVQRENECAEMEEAALSTDAGKLDKELKP